MKICDYTDVKPSDENYAPGVALRWVVGEADGAPHFAMRVIDVNPGAATQHHEHWWEHEVFVVDGSGQLRMDDGYYPLHKGTVIYITGGEKHQLIADKAELLRFICVIPHPKLKGLLEAETEEEESEDIC